MWVDLFNKGGHACVACRDLVRGEAVQSNQLLIIDGKHAALIDSGGKLTYNTLYKALSNDRAVKNPDHVVASHQDPDIDPTSKILFSRDMGANLCPVEGLGKPVRKLDEGLPCMEGFHRRYMNSQRICRFRVNIVCGLNVKAIVPQHGRSFRDKKVINGFLGWIEDLECGIDPMTQENYHVPKSH